MRALLIAIIVAAWLLLGWCYYHCADACCDPQFTEVQEKKVEAPVASVIEKITGPILYNWSKSDPVTDDTWPNKKQSILSGLRDNQNLEITGLYRADEVNNTSFENLGIARANESRKLFPELPDERISLLGKLVTDEVDRNNLFESVSFNNRMVTKTITETEDRTLIYFPFNSTRKLNDREVENYLSNVAKRVIASGEKVRLTGHTDNIGSDASNMRLGEWRSDVVRNYLLSKGVSASQVITQSKGESSPIAPNTTDAGRAKNRRTELEIIK